MRFWLLVSLALTPLVTLFGFLTALAERSGPIRLRHWLEEAGGRLRSLHDHPARFSVFRFTLNMFAKLGPLALFAAVAEALAAAGSEWVFLPAGVVVALVIAASEGASRALLGSDPEEALRRLTGVYRLLLLLLWPLVVIAAPLARRRPELEEPTPEDEEASEEEVEAFIDVGTREGILEPEDRDLVWGVVDFGDTQVRSVMTPRVDIVSASVEEPLERLAEIAVATSVSRLPLYRGSVDHIVGILHIRDLFAGYLASPRPPAAELAKPPLLVPGTKLLGDLLKEFQARRQQMAMVIDEFGGTEGLVTVEDLVEEIVGEIDDEYDEAEPENLLLEDGSLRLDGRAAIEALDEFFDWRPEDTSSETVGGLVSGIFGYVPQAGEQLDLDGLSFEVERADERRILSLRVRRAAPGAAEDHG
jgi:CBS domain containing-hemolysin-like protein